MRPGTAIAAVLALTAAAWAMGGCAGRERHQPPARQIAASYPSPDYPPQAVEPATAPPAPRPQGLSERDLPPAPAAPEPARPLPAAPPARPAPAPAPAPEARFNAMDTDRNGRVTLEEWRASHEKEFRRLDQNDDGVLSREEMTQRPSGRAGGQGAHAAP